MCHCEAPTGPWQSREGTRSLQAAGVGIVDMGNNGKWCG